MVIAHCSLRIDDFIEERPLPPTDFVRPRTCGSCGALGQPLGRSPNLVGHGTSKRLVRGAGENRDVVVIRVRRFLCRKCGATTTVLPSEVYPRRHYSAPAILASLVRVVVEKQGTGTARQELWQTETTATWRAPLRWKRELFKTLWPAAARQVGFLSRPASEEQRIGPCLSMLVALLGTGPSPSLEALAATGKPAPQLPSSTHAPRGRTEDQSFHRARAIHPHGLSRRVRTSGLATPSRSVSSSETEAAPCHFSSDTGGPCLRKPRGPGQSPGHTPPGSRLRFQVP